MTEHANPLHCVLSIQKGDDFNEVVLESWNILWAVREKTLNGLPGGFKGDFAMYEKNRNIKY